MSGVIAILAGGGSGHTPQANAFIARTSGLDTTHKNLYYTLIDGLVADGIWSQLNALWMPSTQDSTTATLNLVSTSFTLGPQAGITFSADHGYYGNGGATAYITTSLIPSTAGAPYTLNSASFGCYLLNTEGVGFKTPIGCVDATYGSFMYPQYQAGFAGGRLNSTAGSGFTTTNSFQGSWCYSRTASTTWHAYLNGTDLGNDATAPGALPTVQFYLLANNNNGTVATNMASGSRIASAFVGGGLSTADVQQLQSRINAWMTSLGINVY